MSKVLLTVTLETKSWEPPDKASVPPATVTKSGLWPPSERTTVPVLVLLPNVRDAPENPAENDGERVSVVPVLAATVPEETTIISLDRVRSVVPSSVPPLNVMRPLELPRLAAAEIAKVPALIDHGVSAVVVPVSVQVLLPTFS